MSVVPRWTFAVVAGLAVIGAVAAGIVALGSPSEQRARRLDERRLEDLRALARGIEIVWSQSRRLPRALDELPAAFVPEKGDPATGQPYEYEVLSESRYQLCATFQRDVTAEKERPSAGMHWIYLTFWTHGAGRNCFQVEPKASLADDA